VSPVLGSTGAHPSEAHLAADADGRPLLCVLCATAQLLLAFRLPSPGGPPAGLAFTTAAVSAAAVCATAPAGGPRELLVLRPGGALDLLRGVCCFSFRSKCQYLHRLWHCIQPHCAAPAACC
jgi:hypothetical protein